MQLVKGMKNVSYVVMRARLLVMCCGNVQLIVAVELKLGEARKYFDALE